MNGKIASRLGSRVANAAHKEIGAAAFASVSAALILAMLIFLSILSSRLPDTMMAVGSEGNADGLARHEYGAIQTPFFHGLMPF